MPKNCLSATHWDLQNVSNMFRAGDAQNIYSNDLCWAALTQAKNEISPVFRLSNVEFLFTLLGLTCHQPVFCPVNSPN